MRKIIEIILIITIIFVSYLLFKFENRNRKEFIVTAYCSCEICCGRWADGMTANGYKIQKGDKFIAASKEYPFGTKMNVPGYGIAEVKDRGSSIKGDKIDVYFDTHQEALEWGVKTLVVEIMR